MQLYTYSVCDFIQWAQKKENVCCFAQTGTSIDIERKTGGTGYSVEGVQKNLFIFLLIYHTPREGMVILIMVTTQDLIKQGKIKEYIPPKAVTHSVKKPVALQESSEVMQEVFQAWIQCDIYNGAGVKEYTGAKGG